MPNRIVVRYADGSVLKGSTTDFSADRSLFHLVPADPDSAGMIEVKIADLKAVFFVRDLSGDAARVDHQDHEQVGGGGGRKIRVRFKDGELLVGTTAGYDRGRPGFFLVPADPASNNERCFVVTSATAEIAFL